MARAYIGVGSNIGDREDFIVRAIDEISKIEDASLKRRSSIYETDPVSDIPQGKYLNAVVEIEAFRGPKELMASLLGIEERLGRTRGSKNSPRTIDLDLLLYDNAVIQEDGLTVPHPRLHQRAFVLRGLKELDPYLIHPVTRKPVNEMYKNVTSEHRDNPL